MLEENKDKRKTSKEILELIQKEFSIKYMKNTSIDSIMRCLYSFKDITNYYLSLINDQIDNKPIVKAYINCLNSFSAQDIEQWFDSIKYFREIISIENTKFSKSKEIEPRLVLAFLISSLHNELNNNSYNGENFDRHYIVSGEQKDKTSKVEMLVNFLNKFLPKFNSFISKQFLGIMKTSHICAICNTKTYSFSNFFFVIFDRQNIPADYKNILGFFEYQNDHLLQKISKFCIKCITETDHMKYKQFYSLPDFLIIYIQRGPDYSCKIPASFSEEIALKDSVAGKRKKYRLVGFINKNYEMDFYYSIIPFQGGWFKCEDRNIVKINDLGSYFNDQNGELIMVFYEAINK